MADDMKEANRIFADKLDKNYEAIAHSTFLEPKDLANLGRLWQVCKDLKAMYDRPRGTADSYRQRKEQLRKEFDRLVSYFDDASKPPKKKK
jgi:hypothetical protein